MTKQEMRQILRDSEVRIKDLLNEALSVDGSTQYRAILTRLGRGGRPPHWFEILSRNGTLPNLDGKTIGSVVEMLTVAVAETHLIPESPPLGINPARGVDLPDFDIGVKSPSTNWCTSEPFFSAYERLIGSDYDAIVLLTNYQTAKANPPLRLQILSVSYLNASEMADRNLCKIARIFKDVMRPLLRDDLFDFRFRQLCKFLAYVNQSDWRAKHILKMLLKLGDDALIRECVERAEQDFNAKNERFNRELKPLIPDVELSALKEILEITPTHIALLDAATRWVSDNLREAARDPSNSEETKLLNGPLDGKIGMSFALQWRYNFQKVFPDIRRGR